jgi:hypothetical protein
MRASFQALRLTSSAAAAEAITFSTTRPILSLSLFASSPPSQPPTRTPLLTPILTAQITPSHPPPPLLNQTLDWTPITGKS